MGVFFGYLLHFPHFGIFYQEKSGKKNLARKIWQEKSGKKNLARKIWQEKSGRRITSNSASKDELGCFDDVTIHERRFEFVV
jgi:hypothetical protein